LHGSDAQCTLVYGKLVGSVRQRWALHFKLHACCDGSYSRTSDFTTRYGNDPSLLWGRKWIL